MSRRTRRALRGAAAVCSGALVLVAAGPAQATEVQVAPGESQVPGSLSDCAGTKVVVYVSRGSEENDKTSASLAWTFDYKEGAGQQLLPVYRALKQLYSAGTVPAADSSNRDSTRIPGLKLVTNRAPRVLPPDADSVSSTQTDVNSLRPDETMGYRAVAIDWEVLLANPTPVSSGTVISRMLTGYMDSVNDGVASATWDLQQIFTYCPTATVILLGYSEGADVTRRAMADPALTTMVTARAAQNIPTAAFLFGDVLWHHSEQNVKYVGNTLPYSQGVMRSIYAGFFNTTWTGVGPQQTLLTMGGPVPLFTPAWNVTSYCNGGDIACQFSGGPLLAEHTKYDIVHATGAASRIAKFIYERSGAQRLDIASNRKAVVAEVTSTKSCVNRYNSAGVPTTVSMRFSLIGDPGKTAPIESRWDGQASTPFPPFTLNGPTTLTPLVTPATAADPTNRVDTSATATKSFLTGTGYHLISRLQEGSTPILHQINIC